MSCSIYGKVVNNVFFLLVRVLNSEGCLALGLFDDLEFKLVKKKDLNGAGGVMQRSLAETLYQPERFAGIYNTFRNVGKYTERAAIKVLNEAKDITYGFASAIRDSAAGVSIPTERSYWKEHTKEALATTVLTSVSATISILTGISLLDVWFSHPSISHNFWRGELPVKVCFFPSNKEIYAPSRGIETRKLDFYDYVGFASPFVSGALAILTPSIEVIRYYRWKKSLKE